MANYVSAPMPTLPRGGRLPTRRMVHLPTPRSYGRLLGGREPIVFFSEFHCYVAPKVRVESLIPHFREWGMGMLGLEPFMVTDQYLLDRYVGGTASLIDVEEYVRRNWIVSLRGVSPKKGRTDGGVALAYTAMISRAAQADINLLAVNFPVTRRNGREKRIRTHIWNAHCRNQKRKDGMTRTAVLIGSRHGELDPAWAAGMLAAQTPVLSIRFIARAIGESQRFFNAVAAAGLSATEFAIPGVDIGLPMYQWVVYLPKR